MPEVADLYVTLRGVGAEFNRSMDEAGLAAGRADGRISALTARTKTLALGTAAAAVAIGAVSVKMASDFQTQMTRLYTAAGAPKDAILGAYSTVLQIGNDVGMTGTKIAEALYHPISAGLDLATALQVVKYSAQEAQISGATLDDTTYSLSSVMKAFNLPASQAGKTMASLNAIVGDGDMRFQDFNESIKNWTPTAAAMGISINSMGAGLAYLTDRGMTAEVASTRLTMGLALMSTPSKQAAKLLETLGVASGTVKAGTSAMALALEKSGITQNQLALDLKKPDGLYVALSDLQTAMLKTGATAPEIDSMIGKIFGGGRSDKAIMSLLQNLDGLKQKFGQIQTDSTTQHFQKAWADTQATFSFHVHQMLADLENFAIRIGLILIPPLNRVMDGIQHLIGWFGKHKQAAAELGTVIKTVLVGALIMAGTALAGMVAEFVIAAAPFIALALGIGLIAKKLLDLYQHNAKFHAFVDRIGNDIKVGFGKAVAWFKEHWPEIHKVIDHVAAVIVRVITDVVTWVRANWPAIWRVTKEVFEGIYRTVSSVIGAVVGFIEKHKTVILKIFRDIGLAVMAVVTALRAGFDLIVAVVRVIVTVVQDLWERFGKHLVDHIETALMIIWHLVTGIFDAIVHVFRGVVNVITGIFQAFTGIFTGHWSKFWGGIEKVFAGIWQIITGLFRGVWTVITSIVRAGMNVVSTVIGAAMAGISAAWGLVWHMIGTALNAVWNGVIKPIFGFIALFIKTVVIDSLHVLETVWDAVIGGIGAVLSGVWKGVIKPIFNLIKTVAIDPISTAIGVLGGIWDTVWTGIGTAVQVVWKVIKPIIDAIKSAIGAVSGLIGGLGKAAGGLIHGVGSLVHGAGSVLSSLNPFALGGWTPGAVGQPSPALVHGGEYVLSNDMLTGRQTVDPAVLAAMYGNASKKLTRGQPPVTIRQASETGPGGGVATVAPIIIQVQGSIIDKDGFFAALESNPTVLFRILQTAALQNGSISSQTWASFGRRRG